jgi:2-dehydrotetronate isomerase
MPRFSANLSFLYTELPFLERFATAAQDGFRAVEFGFAYEFPPEEIAARLSANGLSQVLINAPPGDLAGGERGLGALHGRERDFEASVVTALDYADTLRCPRVHVMAGVVPEHEESADRQGRARPS